MNMHTSHLIGQYASLPISLVSGQGDQVFDDKGNAWWDFYGGHCVASTGHCHPTVVEAVQKQAGEFLFYSTAAQIPVREAAAQAVVDFAPDHIGGVFFCNSGAEANENALKLSLQLTGRKRIVGFKGAFHGRTLLAINATDNPAINEPFVDFGPAMERLPFGNEAALNEADFSDAAAIIVEPVQSMAGVHTASKSWFEALERKARDAGAFLIFDEVQTGFGRLGDSFAAARYGIQPDFMTCAKGIASGVPMGALLVSKALSDQLPPKSLGSTFGGSPVACAALLATLEVIEKENLFANVRRAEKALREGLAGTVVNEVRGAGLLLGLVAGEAAPALKQHLFEQHILLGGSAEAGVLRLMPPLTLTDAAIEALVTAVRGFESKGAAA